MTFRREKDVNRAVSLLDYSSPTRKSAKTCMVFEATFEIHTCTKQTDKEKKKDTNTPLENYLIGVLSHWIPAEEKKNQGTSRRRWRVVLNNSHCIQYCLKSWSSHLPSAVRRIPLGALLIPRMTMRSIQAAVVYWVFGVSRLQKREKKHEWNLATLDLHCGSSTTELQGTLTGLNDNPSTYCYEF